MKYKLIFLSICFMLLAFSNTIAQSEVNSGKRYTWNPKLKSYELSTLKRHAVGHRPGMLSGASHTVGMVVMAPMKSVISHKKVWMFTTRQKPGYWRGARPNELKGRRKVKSDYMNSVSFNIYRKHPRPFSITGLTEDKKFLEKGKAKNINFESTTARKTVHYLEKIRLGLLSFAGKGAHIVVTDTLFVPVAAPFRSAIMGLERRNQAYLKIIANCIVYESPVVVSSVNQERTDIVFSARSIKLRSPYKNVQAYELKPPPPLFTAPGDPNIKFYRDRMGDKEKTLLNRLYVNMMNQSFNDLNTTNGWVRDKLLLKFQEYRFNRVNTGLLANDLAYEKRFNNLCEKFDAKYLQLNNQVIREIAGIKILVSGKVDDFPKTPFKYYALPNKVDLLPMVNASSSQLEMFGEIHYKPTADAKLRLRMDTKLGYDQKKLQTAQSAMNKVGLVLEENPPLALLAIDRQPLKINGKVLGEIVPIGNQVMRLEIDLKEETKTLLELFPKTGGPEFKVDFKLAGAQEVLMQVLQLQIEKTLFETFDPNEPLKSFNIIESTTITETLTVTSALDPVLEEGGPLNFVEILLSFNFDGKDVFQGPFRFSSHNTLASETLIPFVKHSDDYSVVVHGKAYYEDGERMIEPFEANSGFIVLDESRFKTD